MLRYNMDWHYLVLAWWNSNCLSSVVNYVDILRVIALKFEPNTGELTSLLYLDWVPINVVGLSLLKKVRFTKGDAYQVISLFIHLNFRLLV